MSEPLRSRPIDFCLEEKGDPLTTGIIELKSHKLPGTTGVEVAAYSYVALYEAHSSEKTLYGFGSRINAARIRQVCAAAVWPLLRRQQ
jgi:hypothetical protein